MYCIEIEYEVTVRMLRDLLLSVCLSVTLVYCDQPVGWIKMPLGTEVGLGPGHIVLDGTKLPPPTERGTAPPHTHFRGLRTSLRSYKRGPCLLWPNGWMDQDATWYGPGEIVLDGRPRFPSPFRGRPQFWGRERRE